MPPQVVRRLILSSIVQSESSYLESLKRILQVSHSSGNTLHGFVSVGGSQYLKEACWSWMLFTVHLGTKPTAVVMEQLLLLIITISALLRNDESAKYTQLKAAERQVNTGVQEATLTSLCLSGVSAAFARDAELDPEPQEGASGLLPSAGDPPVPFHVPDCPGLPRGRVGSQREDRRPVCRLGQSQTFPSFLPSVLPSVMSFLLTLPPSYCPDDHSQPSFVTHS